MFNFFICREDKLMKKLFITLLLSVLCGVFPVKAEEYGRFYDDVMISNDIRTEEDAQKAKNKASSLLDKKAPVIKIDGMPDATAFRSNRDKVRSNDAEKNSFGINRASQPVIVENTATKYGEGPFGLSWGGTYKQIKALGVELEKVDIKDHPNSFVVTQLPKPLADIKKVIISFGDDNLMWRVFAYGNQLDDDPDAAKVLKLYRQYYKLLNQKYGNGKEFFTPKIITVEKPSKDEQGRDTIETIRVQQPIGNPHFLADLQSGEASLYATFEDSRVGAALAVTVDANGKSFIIIDFTNLQIFKEREEQTLNAL